MVDLIIVALFGLLTGFVIGFAVGRQEGYWLAYLRQRSEHNG